MKAVYIALLLLCFIPLPTTAQGAPGNSAAQLELAPRDPAPGEVFTVKVNAYAYNTTGATITWSLNDEPVPAFNNQRTVSLTAGSIGAQTKITAVITQVNGQTVVAEQTLTINDIDLIIEADTQVPSFYQGRALPSPGSKVRIVAIPKTSTGALPQEFVYTWRVDGRVLGGGSSNGGYVASFTMPKGRGATLVVDVTDQQGKRVVSKSILIENTTPELFFYADNPLRGLSRIAIPDFYNLLGSEVTMRAEAYFMSRNIASADYHQEWQINGRTISNPSSDPQLITLQNAGGAGSFNISYHSRNLKEILQGVEDSFTINF